MRVLARVGLTAALLVLSLNSTTSAQGDAGSRHNTPPPAGSNTKVIYRDRPIERIVRVTPKSGTLTIVAEPGASIRLQYLTRTGDVAEESNTPIPSRERSIILNDLRPGRYRVLADLNGYRPAAGDVRVIAGKADKVDLKLVQITYDVNVKVNAGSGTLRYAKAGEVFRSVLFQNNVVALSGLTAGDYAIEIKSDDASYVTKNTNLRVPGDGNQISIDLERLESGPFVGAHASDWTLPGGWSFSSGKVIVRGNGLALPSDVNHTNYANFQLSTEVRMINGVAASFAVHVVDPRNYYLVEITGPNSDEQYVLRGFIVKNGVTQRFGNITTISQFSETLKPGKFITVVLTMYDADITVSVQDTETGDVVKLGILRDPSRTFRIGAVGIAARDNEQNEVSNFIVSVSK